MFCIIDLLLSLGFNLVIENTSKIILCDCGFLKWA